MIRLYASLVQCSHSIVAHLALLIMCGQTLWSGSPGGRASVHVPDPVTPCQRRWGRDHGDSTPLVSFVRSLGSIYANLLFCWLTLLHPCGAEGHCGRTLWSFCCSNCCRCRTRNSAYFIFHTDKSGLKLSSYFIFTAVFLAVNPHKFILSAC
jgi:hypothetical protein